VNLEYKPSPNLLDCLIKYKKKKSNIENYALDSVWNKDDIKDTDYKKLHSFFWLFSLDLKSPKSSVHSVILKWINKNQNFNADSWEIDILSKRIIAWISYSKLTYDDSNEDYKFTFNSLVQKQINHLINEIKRTKSIDNKMISCSAVILAGLSYKEQKYLDFGLSLLKKIIKSSFDEEIFPKSRNIRQLNFYLKYFILIREWLRESQNNIPEYIDEIIYHLGQAYALVWQSLKKNILFNGNIEFDLNEFDEYIKRLGYKFKNENYEVGGYTILKNKKISLIMDTGVSPEREFSDEYQSGALSFEILLSNKKLICNSGYFQNYKHKLNDISKSTANHSTLIIDNNSSCKLIKQKNQKSRIEHGLKILNKKIIFEKNYWSINSAHDGYLKKYGIIHERKIEFFPEQNKFTGTDSLIKKKRFKISNFEIRFHLTPDAKIMKTQDERAIFIEIDQEGWKFSADNYKVGIETGLFFGKKNSYLENSNFFISGMTQIENQTIKWELIRIS
tara:strand:+ start:583 stop:2094 length:1512 start_codon:yes stop_codon:yes gene_type:complete